MFCVMLIYIYLGGAEGLALPVAVAELARLVGGGGLSRAFTMKKINKLLDLTH
ncbi:hypothetical protein Syun_009100 [Stephania yunnanensis]|uniref:Uncharacterized protein n=1 Tax=Stephania yunnanensis TaxID=152371 RepID=A0AAP0PRZ4_9MAGN